MKQKTRDCIDGYLFILPNIIGFFIFSFLPIVMALGISFTDWNGFGDYNFINIKNYIELFQHDTFRISVLNTLYFSIGVVPIQLILGMIVAIILNQKLKGIKLYRSIFFMPYITSIVAVSILWAALLNPNYGPINLFLESIGLTPPDWLGSTTWAMPTVIMMTVWKGFGYYVVIYLAGLQSIPSQLYEAAEIDGASWFSKIMKITVPMLAPVTFFNFVIAIINSFKVFDQVYMMTEGGPGRATTTMVQYIYTNAFEYYRFGYSSAASVILFLMIFILTVVQMKNKDKVY